MFVAIEDVVKRQAEELEEEEERVASLVQKCPNMRLLQQIHSYILTRQLPSSTISFSLSKIIGFCALSPLGNIFYAERVLLQIPNPNIFSWNSLIRGFSQSKISSPTQPISIFKSLIRRGHPRPNSFTLAFVLKACSMSPAFQEGQQVHSGVVRSGFSSSPFLQSSLVSFYAKHEEIELARKVFDEMPDRNMIAWSTMIGGYAKLDMFNEALRLFGDMQKAGVIPDEITMATVVSACAGLGALDIGRWLHSYINKQRINTDLKLSTALINMYSKCGCIEKAREVFDEMPTRDSRAWSSMIIGFAIHGHAHESLRVFSSMQESQVKPNHVAFLGVLLACAHGRLVSKGQRCWASLLESGIEPSMEHYSCMVDLFCRANLFKEAYGFIRAMPMDPDPVIWRTFLVACKKKKDMEKGEFAGQRLLELEPLNPENYVLFSNFYACCSAWSKMGLVRKQMREKGLKSVPGCSSIEVDGGVREFVLDDRFHPETEEIREILCDISSRIF